MASLLSQTALLQVRVCAHPLTGRVMPALHIADACRVPVGTCLTPNGHWLLGEGRPCFPLSVSRRSGRQGRRARMRLRPVAVCDPVTAGAAA